MPKELVASDGAVAWSASHSAYGRIVSTYQDPEAATRYANNPVKSPFRLLGQVADEDAELCWTRFRCFDPETGTWLSTDPLGLLGGFNGYAFDGSPTDVVDPLGLAGDPHDEDSVDGNLKAIKEKHLEKQGIDAHALKEDFVGRGSISKFNIAENTDTGELVLVPVVRGSGANVPTGITTEDAKTQYPLEDTGRGGGESRRGSRR